MQLQLDKESEQKKLALCENHVTHKHENDSNKKYEQNKKYDVKNNLSQQSQKIHLSEINENDLNKDQKKNSSPYQLKQVINQQHFNENGSNKEDSNSENEENNSANEESNSENEEDNSENEESNSENEENNSEKEENSSANQESNSENEESNSGNEESDSGNEESNSGNEGSNSENKESNYGNEENNSENNSANEENKPENEDNNSQIEESNTEKEENNPENQESNSEKKQNNSENEENDSENEENNSGSEESTSENEENPNILLIDQLKQAFYDISTRESQNIITLKLQFNNIDIQNLKQEIENINSILQVREKRKLDRDSSYQNLKEQKNRLNDYLYRLGEIDCDSQGNKYPQKEVLQIKNVIFVLVRNEDGKHIHYYSFLDFLNEIRKYNQENFKRKPRYQKVLIYCLNFCLILPIIYDLFICLLNLYTKLLTFIFVEEIQDLIQFNKVDIKVEKQIKFLVGQDQFYLDDRMNNLEILLSENRFIDNQEDVSKLERIKLFLLNPSEKNYLNIEKNEWSSHLPKLNFVALILINTFILQICLTFIYQSILITQLSYQQYIEVQSYIDVPYIVCFVLIQTYEFILVQRINRFIRDPNFFSIYSISSLLGLIQSIIEKYQLYTNFKFALSLYVHDTLGSSDLGAASLVFILIKMVL